MFPFNNSWDHQKILRFSYDLREFWKKTLEQNGLMLPWGVFHEVYAKTNVGFGRSSHLVHTFTLLATFSPHVRCVRRGILFSVFHIMFTKKTEGISSKLFVLGRKFFDFVTWRSSTLRNVQISYQCATRFKKTPEWVVGFIILLVYTHIHISFIQHKFPIWDMIIGPWLLYLK